MRNSQRDTRKKYSNPFYSTKGVGQGTGLGLSISYGIIRDYQGQIQVNSRVGSGTTFILQFPALKPIERRPAETEVSRETQIVID